MAADQWFVYEMSNAAGAVLYVGCTKSMDWRMRGHRTSKAWWPQVESTRVKVFMDRGSALMAERKLIETLQPPHNIEFTAVREADIGYWPTHIERLLVNATAPMSTGQVRKMTGYENSAAVLHRLWRKGNIKPVGWSVGGCRTGYFAHWAHASKPWPAVARPDPIEAAA